MSAVAPRAPGLFDALVRAGALRTLDHALAQSLRRLDANAAPAATTPDLVLAGAALASLAVVHGHAGLDPQRPQLLTDADVDWPSPAAWRDALAASRWVATPPRDVIAPTDAPLVLDGGVLYLRRYREYERRLAAGLRALAAHAPPPPDAAALAPLFAALFPHARDGADGGQGRAAALALQRSLLLVTGGPGTGKTTTIARLLLLLLAQARSAGAPPPRIALAAPTGRAAERMAESLRAASIALRAVPGIDATLCDALPVAASTLHRLLGTIPDRPTFRHDAQHPLPFDAVIVDEASMVDLPLMCKLVEAVPPGARLVLLGDRDQLPSVEAGDVLAAMVDASGSGLDAAEAGVDDTLPADVTAALAPLLGGSPLAASPASPPRSPGASGPALAGHRAHLRRAFRQAEAFDLAPLAQAVRDGDADTALARLRDGALRGVQFHEGLLDPLDAHRDALLAHWRALADAADPVQALADAARLRVLTALRDGAQGARALNARIEDALAGRHAGFGAGHGERGYDSGYFRGRLLLVGENSYRHRLFNGDVGVCLPDASGAPVAWFAGGGDGVRGFHPGALPAHEGAFAMTVHKAQGSEFDAVWLLLPRQDARVLSRELVYTALTRARRELHLCAGEAVLRAALARHAERVSGLAWRLRDAG